MTGSNRGSSPDRCGGIDLSPKRPRNRPGSHEISYRIGRHHDFLARMKAAIPLMRVTETTTGTTSRPLAALTTRGPDDPTIGLLDAWAASLDVLSFYQERIANEGYLPTARDRLSVVELARTIGYEADPGVAASTDLAFTVEDADDPFRVVDIPSGVQVLSVPEEPDEVPQTFETVESIVARAEWNAIAARTEQAQHLALLDNAGDDNDGALYLLDLDNSFVINNQDDARPGASSVIRIGPDPEHDYAVEAFLPLSRTLNLERALAELSEDQAFNPDIAVELRAVRLEEIYLRGLGLNLEAGTRLLMVGIRVVTQPQPAQHVRAVPFQVVDVTEEGEFDITRVVLRPIVEREDNRPPPPAPPLLLSVAIAAPVLALGSVATQPVAFNSDSVRNFISRNVWSGSTLSAFVQTQAWPRIEVMELVRRPRDPLPPEVGTIEPGVYALRQRVGAFGNAAPKHESLQLPDGAYTKPWEPNGVPVSIWRNSQGEKLRNADVFLEREVPEVTADGWVLLETSLGKSLVLRVAAASTTSISDFALSGKATGLVLRQQDGGEFSAFEDPDAAEPVEQDDLEKFDFRSTTAFAASEPLALAGLPIREPLDEKSSDVTLDSLYLDFQTGRPVSIGGERADAPGIMESEIKHLLDVTHIGGFTRLTFDSGLSFGYRRPSVRINGNVAHATHGERQSGEVLGDGNASLPNQAFALTKPPLTFVSAATPSGSQTTLSIRVDQVAWTQVKSLHDAGPDDPAFNVRIDDDGTTRVVFGDGRNGRRLPSGALNVVADYRSSMGPEGEVGEETLTLLKQRPLGIRAVTNPSPAGGSAPAEGLEELRERAPQSVRTLDRIVSLTDYEDFARGFTGIGKARVDSLWYGDRRIIHLTVAPTVPGEFPENAATPINLRSAIEDLRNPGPELIVAAHAHRLFSLYARLFVDPRYVAEDVAAAVRAALELALGYTARNLAQATSAAEAISIMQAVAGVDHLDLKALVPYREGAGEGSETEAGQELLPAAPARISNKGPNATLLPAELLTILPAAIVLETEYIDA